MAPCICEHACEASSPLVHCAALVTASRLLVFWLGRRLLSLDLGSSTRHGQQCWSPRIQFFVVFYVLQVGTGRFKTTLPNELRMHIANYVSVGDTVSHQEMLLVLSHVWHMWPARATIRAALCSCSPWSGLSESLHRGICWVEPKCDESLPSF